MKIFLLVKITRLGKINASTIEFKHSQVRHILSGLDANKASGRDNLKSRILKECAVGLPPFLALLLKMNFVSGYSGNKEMSY